MIIIDIVYHMINLGTPLKSSYKKHRRGNSLTLRAQYIVTKDLRFVVEPTFAVPSFFLFFFFLHIVKIGCLVFLLLV